MSKHDDYVSMRHMLDYAQKARQMVQGRNRPELESNEMLKYALTRLVEVVGEAASRVSVSTRLKYQEIPWPDIVGMRSRLIHGYDVVYPTSPGLLRQAVTNILRKYMDSFYHLDSYIISATPFDVLRKKYDDGRWDKGKFAGVHILFPERSEEYDYMKTIFQTRLKS